MENVAEKKRTLRRSMHARLTAFCTSNSGKTAADASGRACTAVKSLAPFTEAQTVLFYMPMPQEADCTALIEFARAQGKSCAIPRVETGTSTMDFYLLDANRPLSEQLQTGAWGIREPVLSLPRFEPETAAGRICMIVPGVAFSNDGKRLGHGKGYYDRYIARLQKSAAVLTLCGFCFAVQLTEDIPVDSFDVPMHAVATENGCKSIFLNQQNKA